MKKPAELAALILQACLEGEAWPAEALCRLVDAALSPASEVEASRALFGTLVEGLSDRFEPRLSDVYGLLFSQVIASVLSEWTPDELAARYRRVRAPRRFEGDPQQVRDVFVLSRVTLGADVAITSVALDAARRRFPGANVFLAGSEKSFGLFAADPRIHHLKVAYGRGATLRERLAVSIELRRQLTRPGTIVIDPDSRLTQLGLVPVCDDESYFFFDSRSYGEEGDEPLAALACRWVAATFDIGDARPFIAPLECAPVDSGPPTAVSLGVGENPAKRIPDPFESELLRALAERGAPLLVDTGAGGEESERVRRAVRAAAGAAPGQIRTWEGSFAAFAAAIARSRLYVGYDSAGQHVAAACGVPLVTVFAGFPCARMFARWRPSGRGRIEVVRVERPEPALVLRETLAAAQRAIA